MLPQEVIRHKRDGQQLTKEEIEFFVQGITDWSVSECQISALVMAIYLRGFNNDEIVNLTRAMTFSGQMIQWAAQTLDGPVLDKHSTGGVGDKIRLIFPPMIAACGGYVPAISGRSLGHAVRTLDKLDSIPGYLSSPSIDKFRKTIRDVGCAIIAQTGDMAPADKRLYAARETTATADCIPLITASILSKKLALSLDGLVMDLKIGNGAFVSDIEDARKMARTMVKVGALAEMPTNAVISDMNQVLGHSIGTAVEVAEAVDYLTGKYRDSELHELTLTLCAETLVIKGLADNRENARQKLQHALDTGKAAEIFGKMVSALGGPVDFIEKYDTYLPRAKIIRPVFAKNSGYVQAMDTRTIGASIQVLDYKRKVVDQKPNYAVGFTEFTQIGDEANTNRPIAIVHAADEDSFASVEKILQDAVQISAEKPVKSPVVYETITND